VGFIEGYNLIKTVSKHKKASADKQEAVAVSAIDKNTSTYSQSGKILLSSAKLSDSKTNQKKESAAAEKIKSPAPSSKTEKKEDQPKASQAVSLSPEQGREPPAPKKVRAVPVSFTFSDPQAKEVTFHGSWSGKAYAMKSDGNTWKFSTRLNPGEYAYHFRADGVRKVNPGPLNAAGDNIIKVSPAE